MQSPRFLLHSLVLLFALSLVSGKEPTWEVADPDGIQFTIPFATPTFTLNASLYHEVDDNATVLWAIHSTPYDDQQIMDYKQFLGGPFELEQEEERINVIQTLELKSGKYEFSLFVRKADDLYHTRFKLVILDVGIPAVPCVCAFSQDCTITGRIRRFHPSVEKDGSVRLERLKKLEELRNHIEDAMYDILEEADSIEPNMDEVMEMFYALAMSYYKKMLYRAM